MRARILPAAVLVVISLVVAPAAHASTTHDLRGTWNCCGAGGAGEQDWTITSMGTSSGHFSGRGAGGGYHFPVSGTASGNSVTLTTGPYDELPSYTATFTGTISGDSSTMSGSWSSNGGQSGTWTATRSGKHPTATDVSCNRGPFSFSDSQCTASVDNTDGVADTPTGTVTWTADTGSFRSGTCTLSPVAGDSASCSVTYLAPPEGTPAGVPLPVTASYAGDSKNRPSSGKMTEKIAVDSPDADDCNGVATGAGAAVHTALANHPPATTPGGHRTEAHEVCAVGANATAKGLLGKMARAAGNAARAVATMDLSKIPLGEVQKKWHADTGFGYTVNELLRQPSLTERLLGKETKDPPDRRHAKQLAKLRKLPHPRVNRGKGLSRGGAKAVTKLIRTLLKADAVRDVLGKSIDRAGGAAKLGSRTWKRRQLLAAVKWARQLAKLDDRVAALLPKAYRAGRHIHHLVHPTRKLVKRTRHARLSKAAQRALIRAGFTRADLRALLRGARAKLPRKLPSLLIMLGDPDTPAYYRLAAATHRLYAAEARAELG
jgi:hypothetical protein